MLVDEAKLNIEVGGAKEFGVAALADWNPENDADELLEGVTDELLGGKLCEAPSALPPCTPFCSAVDVSDC